MQLNLNSEISNLKSKLKNDALGTAPVFKKAGRYK